MKKIVIIFLIVLISGCSGKNGGSLTPSSIGTAEEKLRAKFLGTWLTECLDLGPNGYGKIYIDLRETNFYEMINLYHAADSTCSGGIIGQVNPFSFSPVTEPALLVDDEYSMLLTNIDGIAENYFPLSWNYFGTLYFSIFYYDESNDRMYMSWPLPTTNVDPGPTWGDWEADGSFGAFAVNYTNGMWAERVAPLP